MIPALCQNRSVDRSKALYPVLIVTAMTVTTFSLVVMAGIAGDLPGSQPDASANPALSSVSKQTVALCGKDCGVVEEIRRVDGEGGGSGLGVVIGGLAGAVLGQAISNGDGADAVTLIASGVGAVAGNEIEKQSKRQAVYQTRVRMDDGVVRVVSQETLPDWQAGSKVKLVNGQFIRYQGS